MTITIKGSVGRDGDNRRSDTKKIQRALNERFSSPALDPDGDCGRKTINRIKRFQKTFMPTPDARVDTGGRTLGKLNETAPGLQPRAVAAPVEKTWQRVGKSFTPDAFEAYIATVAFNVWRLRFVVLHNTSVPERSTWDGWQERTRPITDEKWGRNLESYYKGEGWSGCPHLFVTPKGILVMNHLNRGGVHTPSWNSISCGVETVGEFDRDPFTGSIRDNLVAALVILHATAGLQLLPYERGVRGLHLHKEDPKTTHRRCPGKNIVKADLIKAVQAEIVRRTIGEHPADEGANIGIVRTAPDDPLNLREEPRGRAKIVTTLKNGAKVTVLGGKNVGSTRWLNIDMAGSKSGWVAARYVEIT